MNTDEQAIRNLVDDWLNASRRGDTEGVLRLMADDVVFMVPGQPPFGKEAFAATSAALANVRIDGTNDIQELHVLGNWAWMRNYLKITVTPAGGKPIHRSGYTLTILRKNPDRTWVIARDANLVTVDDAQQGPQPQKGIAAPGEPVVPRLMPRETAEKNPPPRSAPGPGVPVGDKEYKRLKKKARTARTTKSKNAQEDPAAKKK